VIGNDDRPSLAGNVLEPLDFDAEVTAKKLKPDAVESLEAVMFDEFDQIHSKCLHLSLSSILGMLCGLLTISELPHSAGGVNPYSSSNLHK
jgi:hypothetical protein